MKKTIRSGTREVIHNVFMRTLSEQRCGKLLTALEDVYKRTADLTEGCTISNNNDVYRTDIKAIDPMLILTLATPDQGDTSAISFEKGPSLVTVMQVPTAANPRMYGQRIVPIRGDGNCMFRSVSYCIYGNTEHHYQIRLQVVDQVVSQWKRYKDFIIGDQSYGAIRDAKGYRNLMSRDGEYAGHVELHCVSELYPEFTFKVHRNGYRRTIDYGYGRRVKHLLFSGYLDAGHYSVIEY